MTDNNLLFYLLIRNVSFFYSTNLNWSHCWPFLCSQPQRKQNNNNFLKKVTGDWQRLWLLIPKVSVCADSRYGGWLKRWFLLACECIAPQDHWRFCECQLLPGSDHRWREAVDGCCEIPTGPSHFCPWTKNGILSMKLPFNVFLNGLIFDAESSAEVFLAFGKVKDEGGSWSAAWPQGLWVLWSQHLWKQWNETVVDFYLRFSVTVFEK